MKLLELRKALPVMPEDQIWNLADLYSQFSSSSEEDTGGYGRKLDAIEAELQRRENPRHQDKVDEPLSKKVGFWKKEVVGA